MRTVLRRDLTRSDGEDVLSQLQFLELSDSGQAFCLAYLSIGLYVDGTRAAFHFTPRPAPPSILTNPSML